MVNHTTHPHALVYFVACPTDITVLIAMDVRTRGNRIRWFDTVKERVMRIGHIIEQNGERCVFERVGHDGQPMGTYTIIPLTLDVYRANVRDRLPQPKEFENEAAMHAAFLETRRHAW